MPVPGNPTEKLYYDFALMCDTVILYWQEVDCTCTVHTVPRDAVALTQSIYLNRQMQSVSKIKLPSIAVFSGKHSEWRAWKENTVLSFKGLGYKWITRGLAASPGVLINRKIGVILHKSLSTTVVDHLGKILEVDELDVLGTELWKDLVSVYDHADRLKYRKLALTKVIQSSSIASGHIERDSNSYLCNQADLILLEREMKITSES